MRWAQEAFFSGGAMGSASWAISAEISFSTSSGRSPMTSLPPAGTEMFISSSITTRFTYSRSSPRTVRVDLETMRTGPWTGCVSTSPTFEATVMSDAAAADKGFLLCGPAHRRYRGPGGVEAASSGIVTGRTWARNTVVSEWLECRSTCRNRVAAPTTAPLQSLTDLTTYPERDVS